MVVLLKTQNNDNSIIKMYKKEINQSNQNEPSILNHILDIGEIE